VAAVDQLQLAAPAELGEHRGDEVLLAKPRPDAVVQLGGQLDQAGVGGSHPEPGQHQRGQLHGLQALTLNVADQHRRPCLVTARS
jgi:hypothetical protein